MKNLILLSIFIICLKSTAQTTFQKKTIDPIINNITGIYSDDINNDGYKDIVVCENANHKISLWQNSGGDTITWTKYSIDTNFNNPLYVVIKDVDKDNKMDIIVSSSMNNRLAWWKNEGGNPVLWTKQTIDSVLSNAHAIDVADFNNDGFNDIVATASGANRIVWWENNGANPINWTKRNIDSTFPTTQTVMAADINNDQRIDVVAGSSTSDVIAWWKNTGGSPVVWEKKVITSSIDFPHWIQVVDMDNDDDMDVLGSGYFSGEISWWENDTLIHENWTKHNITMGFQFVLTVQAAYIDDDSLIDVVGTNPATQTIAWWKNRSNNNLSWYRYNITTSYKGAWPLFVTDLDNDNDQDIIAGADVPVNNPALSWWKNQLNETGISDIFINDDYNNELMNYPNPFRNETKISFNLKSETDVKLIIYDINENIISILVNNRLSAGRHLFNFNAEKINPGIYFCKLFTSEKFYVTKFIIL